MTTNVGQKSILALISTVFGFMFNSLTEMAVVLFIFIVLDYPLGILAAMKQGQRFDKDLALWGAVKKVLYAVVVAMGFSGDFIIQYFSTSAGVDLPVKGFIGLAAIIYLLGTEGFSIIQSLLVLGVPAPPFLLQFFSLIKDQAGRIVEIPVKECLDQKGVDPVE